LLTDTQTDNEENNLVGGGNKVVTKDLTTP